MTPQDFASAYRRTAMGVSAGTGIDTVVLLGQWANETAWGTVVVGNNLANIRCSPKSFCRYASLDDFATDCIATWHNGNYAAVLSAPNAPAQLDAVVASPWSAGHYGGNLHPFYDPLVRYEMTPNESAQLLDVFRKLNGELTDGSADPNGMTWDQVVAAIKAIQATPRPVDFKPVLDAITTNDADVDNAISGVATAVGNLSTALKNLTLKAI